MTEPTSDRLARHLEAEGLPADMVEKARQGYYDDFKSPLAMPQMQLLTDLRAHGRDDLTPAVIDGEWDSTPEESKEWAESFEGRSTMAELGPRLAKDVFGVDLPEFDKDMLTAAVEVIQRAGAKELEIRHNDDETRWWAVAILHDSPQARAVLGDAAGQEIPGPEHARPDFAAELLARQLLEGGRCQHCGKEVRLNAPRQDRNKVCRWQRSGDKWKRGCE